MRTNIIKALIALAVPFTGLSQVCNIAVNPQDSTVCPGDSILITSQASITSGGQSFTFNFGVLPAGWSTSGGSSFSSPCGSGIDGTSYFWASTAGSATPQINTPAFDVSCGGLINFDMVYSIQSQSSPCEGPDEADEGISLQYSTDGGITWIDITYFSPGGYELPSNPGVGGGVLPPGNLTQYTTWGGYSIQIPPGAMTTGTMFQWIQLNSSGSAFDNWGLDNIEVAAGPCNSAYVDWNSDTVEDSTDFWYVPATDTFFIADVYDTLGNYQCSSDTIFINVHQNTMTYDLVDTVYAWCPTDSIPVEVLNIQNAPGAFSYSWTTGDTTSNVTLGTNGNKWDTLVYYVDVTDGCGFVRSDSVTMIVNQLLGIDPILSGPASSCNADGWVSATATGVTDTLNQPFYHWEGPGQPPAPYAIDATVMQDIPTGWYYFTVTDDLCTETDSIFVDITNPPVAEFSTSTNYGCAPLTVTFTNTSQNAVTFDWVYGNGTQETVNNPDPTSSTYLSSAQVMLIAYDASNCPDTAYADITVDPCGCTDPNATNYNPLATIDDGSCLFPFPQVVVPNIFTPNDDQENDVFVLDATNAVNIDLVIVNRWGNVVFDQSGLNPAWDGITQTGAVAEEGTYFFKYKLTGINGDIVEGHGFLQLVRD